MRNIENKDKIAAKRKRNQIIVGVILILSMVSSVIGFAFLNNTALGGSTQQKISYNGYDFIRQANGLWNVLITGQNFTTFYNPTEIQYINLSYNSQITDYYGKPLYFVSINQDAENEIIQNLGRYAQRYQDACLQGENCSTGFVAKNCTDNMIIFRFSDNTNTYKTGNCIFVEGSYDYQLKTADKIIFKTIGVN